eukprot:8158722-Pyramimonas_sp.AAC.1
MPSASYRIGCYLTYRSHFRLGSGAGRTLRVVSSCSSHPHAIKRDLRDQLPPCATAPTTFTRISSRARSNTRGTTSRQQH